mmetsp:Transcript_35708/g.70103  ORF Transcript_35708/g.70103 Transcript_35708/m.70103 type:complete len:224 (+) Transcript_35708:617-1288(+)
MYITVVISAFLPISIVLSLTSCASLRSCSRAAIIAFKRRISPESSVLPLPAFCSRFRSTFRDAHKAFLSASCPRTSSNFAIKLFSMLSLSRWSLLRASVSSLACFSRIAMRGSTFVSCGSLTSFRSCMCTGWVGALTTRVWAAPAFRSSVSFSLRVWLSDSNKATRCFNSSICCIGVNPDVFPLRPVDSPGLTELRRPAMGGLTDVRRSASSDPLLIVMPSIK